MKWGGNGDEMKWEIVDTHDDEDSKTLNMEWSDGREREIFCLLEKVDFDFDCFI